MSNDNTQLNRMFDQALANTKVRVMPIRRRNGAYRTREYLTPAEMEQLIAAAAPGRDRTLITVAYVHGLRLAEIVALRWDQIDLAGQQIHITRVKRGTPAIHPIPPGESRMLHALRRIRKSEFVFSSRQSDQLSRSAVQLIFRKAGENSTCTGTETAPVQVHAHMARHACGYRLANQGIDTRTIQAYLGHRSIQTTVKYTVLASDRFEGIWQE